VRGTKRELGTSLPGLRYLIIKSKEWGAWGRGKSEEHRGRGNALEKKPAREKELLPKLSQAEG